MWPRVHMCITTIVVQQKLFIGLILIHIRYLIHFNWYFNFMSHHALLDLNYCVSFLHQEQPVNTERSHDDLSCHILCCVSPQQRPLLVAASIFQNTKCEVSWDRSGIPGRAGSDPLGEHLAGLLCDPDEGGSPAELLQLGCTNIGAGGAEASEHVPDGVLHVPSVGHLHRPALRGPEGRHSQSVPGSKVPVGRKGHCTFFIPRQL